MTTATRRKAGDRGQALLKRDPTRSISQRRAFAVKLRRQFALLKGRIALLVLKEDAFGLALPDSRAPAVNAGWVTLDSGQHVYVGDDGEIMPHGPGGAPAAGKAGAPRKFTSYDDGGEWGREHYGNWAAKLTPEQDHAVGQYVSNSQRVNDVLRGRSDDPGAKAQAARIVPHLDAALAAHPVPEAVQAWRGVAAHAGRDWGGLVGKTFTDPGYFSTSVNANEARAHADPAKYRGGAMLRVTVPKGTPGAYLGAHDSSVGEHELLLGRGLTYRVRAVHEPGGPGHPGAVYGLGKGDYRVVDVEVVPHGHTVNARFQFISSPDKLAAFRRFLAQQFQDTVTGPGEEALWERYVTDGYRRGAGRAFDDVRRRERALAAGDREKVATYDGTREAFLRDSFGRPVAIEKVKLLAGRAFDELEGVTEQMGVRMGRVLADGLVKGDGPEVVARALADEVDIGRGRAFAVAQHELSYAHNEGNLDAMEAMGVEEVGVAVEWVASGLGTTAKGNPSPCERCAAMEGVVLTIAEARGLMPLHVGCLCSWLPANVGEPDAGRKTTKGEIDDALAEADVDDVEVSMGRPESVLNTFCPTGPGGGIDPTCSPHGGGEAGGEHGYAPGSGEGRLYVTRPGAGESDAATREAARATRGRSDADLGQHYVEGPAALAAAAGEEPALAWRAALARDVVRANTKAREDVEVRFKPATGVASVWTGTHGVDARVLLEARQGGTLVRGPRGAKLVPHDATDHEASRAIHAAAGYRFPDGLTGNVAPGSALNVDHGPALGAFSAWLAGRG